MNAPSSKRFFAYVRPHLGALLLALACSVPLALISFGPAPALKYLTDEVLVRHDLGAVRRLSGLLLLGFTVNLVFRFLAGYLLRTRATAVTQKFRNDLFGHILDLSVGYFGEARGGALVGKVINDVQTLNRFLTSLTDLVKDPLIFCALYAYAFYLHWQLALVTTAVLPLLALILGNSGRHSKRYSHRILSTLGEMSSALNESLQGIRVIQAFALEPTLERRFQRTNREFTRTALKAIRMEALAGPGVELVFALVMSGLIFFAASEAQKGRMSPGDVLAFFSCFGMMLAPVKSLSELNFSFRQCQAALDSLFALLDTPKEIRSCPGARALPPFAREIELERVSFAYPGHEGAALHELSLRVRKGEVVALVGPSGAGKSTVLNLLPRFLDPMSGAVRFDGHDLREIELDSLRAQIALVTQEVFLFHDSVRANIKAGRHAATEERVIEAAKAARAWEFIERLPRGLDTVIGDRGQKLSGGERQRLSIARAILKDAPILLLDEATSALDTENERLVQEALQGLLAERTALVVAHRLSTVRRAHRIVVMEKGRIVEEGTHEELQARGGAYARALAQQALT